MSSQVAGQEHRDPSVPTTQAYTGSPNLSKPLPSGPSHPPSQAGPMLSSLEGHNPGRGQVAAHLRRAPLPLQLLPHQRLHSPVSSPCRTWSNSGWAHTPTQTHPTPQDPRHTTYT